MCFFPNKLLLNILVSGLFLSCPMNAADREVVHGSGLLAKNQKSRSLSKQTQNGWNQFTSEESGFSVDLPKKPEHIEQTIEIPKTDLKITYNTFISEPSDSMIYVISVWNYPPEIDMSKPEVNLQDGFGGMLSALPGSEVLNMRMTEVQGFKALEFLVKNEDIFFQGKLILVHNTLYQVFTVYKGTVEMTDNYQRFINSFKLVNPEKRKVHKNNNRKVNV